MALVKQIQNLVNDSVEDAIGKSASAQQLDTSDIVSLGKALSSFEAFDKFYGALANRIAKTVYFVRSYERRTRGVLLDEHDYGAFVQKVYAEMPEAVENPAYDVTQIDGSTGARSYEQASPYDVENVVKISALTFGGQGTWSDEFIYSLEEIKTAFTSESAFMALVDAIYMAVDNAVKLQLERIEADAVNTAMAQCIAEGKARNLLNEYNTLHPTNTLTVAQALEDLDFLKYATKEINRTIKNMQSMSVNFNVDGYATHTPKENLVVEMNSEFASDVASYLQADTFHKELVALPKYNEIPYWQVQGTDASFAFSVCSSIKIKHSQINSGSAVTQSGIVCFLHDTENVACFFGDRNTWEVTNPRSRVVIHGEQARKGYAIDNHANAFVFYLEYIEPTNKKGKKEEEVK